MGKLKFILSLVLLLSVISPSTGQTPKSFTHQTDKFLEEMEAFLALTNKKDAEDLIEKFEPLWKGASFNNEQRERIYFTADAMLKKRLKPFPDFVNYINTLMVFAQSGQGQKSFDAWHNGIDNCLSGSSRNFSAYLSICSGLFQGGYIYDSPAVKWRSSTMDYTFSQDTIPKVVFPQFDLVYISKGDSARIVGTSGVFYPTLKKFIGKGGRVTWERVGLPKDQVYADLGGFAIDVSGSDFEADSVTFYNKQVFQQPLLGKLNDKLLANADSTSASYPRFRSYNTNLEIKELIKDASYKGGFSMHGSKMIGSGTRSNPASLTFNRNNTPFLVALAQSFVIRRERVITDNASVTFYFDKDSMYHPGVEMKYINESKTITITRPSERTIGTPFVSSFHNVDMYFDVLTWKVDDPIMDLKMTTQGEEVKMVFESKGYFRAERYQRIQGIADINPLFLIKQFAETIQSRDISVNDYAAHRKMNDTQIRSLFMSLSSQGFLTYNSSTDRATVKDKLYYYISANSGKSDYDILEFGSQIAARSNATVNLLNFDINMQGVPRVMLSDTQRVYVEPTDQQLTLKKNRDFTFNGRVRAGRFDFRGKEFTFLYNDFKILLKNIDSLAMRIPGTQPNENGQIPNVALQSALQNLTGYLEIDRPDNKSSIKKSPEYPRFTSEGPGYVYYDKPSIYNGVYARDRFYFQVNPFTLDSLDNFAAGALSFQGKLVSGGIFPDIQETLTIQEDLSLGFKQELQPAGLAAYGGKGQYYEKIRLDNQGLTGSGTIKYLTSTSTSKSYTFFPDSTSATGVEFDLAKGTVGGVVFPPGKGSQVDMNWRPALDKMLLTKTNSDFIVYDGQVKQDGKLILTAQGLTGNGKASFDRAALVSNLIKYNETVFTADTSDFVLDSEDPGRPALATTNMKSYVDLKNRYGDFISNGLGSYVTFPYNQYKCFIDRFRWLMDEKNVLFEDKTASKGSKMGIPGAEFISIDPVQDSLRWFAEEAVYSLADYIIRASGVKEIAVADAKVYPDSSKLIVGTDALIQPLKQAKVVADTATKYHVISDATIRIKARRNYAGDGSYEYVDQLKTKHILKLTNIGVDTAYRTFADGEVAEDLNFQLSPNIQYKGKMRIYAPRPGPFFTGYARANHGCESLTKYWFSFASEIDPRGVKVPVKAPKNENGEPLHSTISFSRDSANVYGSFLSGKTSATDKDIISAEGLLMFDSQTNHFRILPDTTVEVKSKRKDDEESKPSVNTFSLSNDDCSFTGTGKIDLGSNFGQFKMNAAGEAKYNPVEDTLRLDMMVGLDFFFSNDALKEMTDLILSFSNLPATNDNRAVFKNGIRVYLDDKKAAKFIEENEMFGAPKRLPDELSSAIFLTDIKLKWVKETLSFRSVGDIGVGYIGKTPVNRMMKGYFEIIRRRSGDAFHLFLELDGNTWFYFNYTPGVMQSISSSIKFNDIITNTKPEKRVADEKGGKSPYQYLLSTERKKHEFIRRIENRD